jgi:hypothetical protein
MQKFIQGDVIHTNLEYLINRQQQQQHIKLDSQPSYYYELEHTIDYHIPDYFLIQLIRGI